MHGSICQNHEYCSKHSKTSGIRPERLHVEAEGAEDRGTGDFDIDAVLVIRQREVLDLVDDKTFKAVVEDGQLTDVLVK